MGMGQTSDDTSSEDSEGPLRGCHYDENDPSARALSLDCFDDSLDGFSSEEIFPSSKCSSSSSEEGEDASKGDSVPMVVESIDVTEPIRIMRPKEKPDISEPSKPEEDALTQSAAREALPLYERILDSTEEELEASIDLEQINNNYDQDELHERAIEYIPPYDSVWWLYLMSIMDPEDDANVLNSSSDSASLDGSGQRRRSFEKKVHRKEQANQKTLTHVGKSRQPYRCVHLHNQKLVSSKSTHGAAGLWSIEMVIGPLRTKSDTFPLRDLWKAKTRGPVSRRDFGKWLSTVLEMECFDSKHGMEDTYADTWKEARMERKRVRCASKAASHNAAFLRRQEPGMVSS